MKAKDFLFLLSKKLLILMSYFACSNFVYGQVNIETPIPANDFAAAKFVTIPVSTYTGIPSINIPLEKLSSRNLKLDFSLSYHAGGFKVGEEATSVGLGWMLNMGGSIVRIVRGESDFKSRQSIPNLPDITWDYISILADTKSQDNQPDLYIYNFGGYTGRFYLSDNGSPVMEDSNNLSIQPKFNTTNEIVAFDIRDSQGILYRFGTNQNFANSAVEPFVFNGETGVFESSLVRTSSSTYYLSEIQSTDTKELISFSYESENYSSTTNTIRSLQDFTVKGAYEGQAALSYTLIRNSSKRLKSVSGPNWKIQFLYLKPREDQKAFNDAIPMELSGVTITDLNNNIYRKINFYTSYFVSSGIESAPLDEKSYYKRLKLDSLRILSNDVNNSPICYRFRYNEQTLPDRRSPAQDLYGFYNGATSNSKDMIPTLKNFELLNLTTNITEYVNLMGGADRNPNEIYMKASVLSEISYPTGGINKFEYQANTYTTLVYPLTTDESSAGITGYDESDQTFTFQKTLNIPAGSEIREIFYEFRLAAKNYTEGYSTCAINDRWFDVSFGLENPIKYTSKTLPLTFLKAGDNTIKLTSRHGLTKLIVTLKDKTGVLTNAMASGLRVSKISTIDGASNIESNYSYLSHDTITYKSTGLSSGSLVTNPALVATYHKRIDNGPINTYKQVLRVYNSPLIDLESTRGGYVGYSEVRVAKNNGSLGSEIFYYTSPKEFPDRKPGPTRSYDAVSHQPYNGVFEYILNSSLQSNAPAVSDESMDFKRGNLIKKIVLNSDEKIIGKEINEYEYISNEAARGIKLQKFYGTLSIGGSSAGSLVAINYNIYREYLGYANLIKKTEISYENQGEPMKKETTYSYFRSPVIINEITENFGTRTIKTVSKYPFSYNNNVLNIKKLLDLNLKTVPIKTERILGTSLIDGKINIYNDFGLIQKEYLLNNDGVISTSPHDPSVYISPGYRNISAYNYDTNNRLVEVQKLSGALTTYVWGYGGHYPVLEIKNATYAEVALVLTQAAIGNLNLATNSEAAMETLVKNAADKLRSDSRLSKAMVTSYTYKPLVGMTSKTDARGIKETYRYDGMQRLQAILDQVGNVTKAIDYHYRPN